MSATEVDQWVEAHNQLSPEARERYDVEQVRTIRKAVAPDLSAAEFQMFMALAAKYDLDPLAKEIWGAKGKSKNGQPGRVLIMVGRDGLLKVARRDRSYAGFDSDVVREKDEFKVLRSKEGREIIHNYEGSTAARGKIIGAWAQVYQKGYHDTYFFAPMDEYLPANADSWSPWKKQPSVMIQKCALALCLRLAFNLSGVVSEEEGARALEDDEPAPEVGIHEVLSVVEDEEIRGRLLQAYLDARNVRPGQLSASALQMSVTGQTYARVLAYVEEVERANAAARDADAPVDAEVVEGTEPIPATDHSGAEVERLAREVPSEEVEALRARLSGLYDRRTAVEEAPSDHAETAAELDALGEEIEMVERKLRDAGGEVPGQEAMNL